MQKNGYPRYEITIPQRTRHRRDTGHGPGRGIGQEIKRDGGTVSGTISGAGRIPTPGTAADASPARAASGRTVFRPGGRMPIRHSTRIFSTHSSAPRRIDARTSTPNFRSGQSSDIT